MIDRRFWGGRRVFLTGHTGFKGAWMALALGRAGAEVTGFSLPPEYPDGVFAAAEVAQDLRRHGIGDIRDQKTLSAALDEAQPEIVVHMAAQALVRRSYDRPVDTYATNVMGTVHLLEAMRQCRSVQAAVIVTSDKCYENLGQTFGYKEGEPLGGSDPYSNSKACAELVTEAYRRSFFKSGRRLPIASVRAGNVIGGGDWAQDRLVPDAMRAFLDGRALEIRNPHAIRPWQHVLDPIMAYMLVAQRLFEHGQAYAEPWNFGPGSSSEVSVAKIADMLVSGWGGNASWRQDRGEHPPEAASLKLDCAKAVVRLGWRPALDIERTIDLTLHWYRGFHQRADMRSVTLRQIDDVVMAAYGTDDSGRQSDGAHVVARA